MAGVHFHDIELKRGSSYIDSLKWIKNKKAAINPKNLKDYYCFQYAIIAALHRQDTSNNRPSRHVTSPEGPLKILTSGTCRGL